MSRRSQRSRSASKDTRKAIPPSIRRGLESLVENNESYVSKILSSSSQTTKTSQELRQRLVNDLEDCMRVNNLSAEMLLARFFDASILSEYSQTILGKSGKGSEATLAARISREWSKPNFSPHEIKKRDSPDASSKKRKLENNHNPKPSLDNDDDGGNVKRKLG